MSLQPSWSQSSWSQSSPSLAVLKRLISFPSVSRQSNRDVSDYVARLLDQRGFVVEETTYADFHGVEKVNLVARRDPDSRGGGAGDNGRGGGLAYFAHTDVVPADCWDGPGGGGPFQPIVHNRRVYGRGACDMKGSLSAMIAAIDRVPASAQNRPIWVVCTADEELGFDGAREVARRSAAYRLIVENQPVAIIGEPTRLQVVHAHKGVTGFEVTSLGHAAHSSTDDGVNANIALMPILQRVEAIRQATRSNTELQDQRFDPPHLSWNYGIRNDQAAMNVTTPRASVWVMLRPMPNVDGQRFIDEIESEAKTRGLQFKRYLGGSAVWIAPDQPLVRQLAVLTGSEPSVVCYGTDGGEFGGLSQRAVLGPGNIAQAHTVDEWISIDQLEKGTRLYAQLIDRYCCQSDPPA